MKSEINLTVSFGDEPYLIRSLSPADVCAEYINWLNLPEIRQYLESVGAETVTVESQREYLHNIVTAKHSLLFGLFNQTGKLVGTSGIQQVNLLPTNPVMGILIGNPDYRGRGLGSVLVWCIAWILTRCFNVDKVTARAMSTNQASVRSFLRAGFTIEGELREPRFQ